MLNLEALLQQMTLAEKAGQMTQVTLDLLCKGKPYHLQDPLAFKEEALPEILAQKAVGSVLNVGTYAHSTERWQEIIGRIQEEAARSRLGVPILYGIDSIHGANYVREADLFPQQLGLAAGANPELIEKLFALAAEDSLAAGMPWLFAPVADLGRHPAWPRLWEGFGEDPYLAGELTAAAVRGIERTGAVSCLKHYLGYGAPASGKDRTPAYLHERQIRQLHLPAFQAGLAAGARTIMVNSSELNGIPLHADPYWLNTVLRDELGFDGLIVTDWEDIRYLFLFHRVAEDYRHAVKLAIQAGIDMSMTPLDTEFTDHVIDLVESGEIEESRIDTSVRRILKLKQELGLFDQPVPSPLSPTPARERQALCQQAAEESVILLRNEKKVLPLDREQHLLVCGPAATSLRSLHGGWTYTWQGERTNELAPAGQPNVLEALRAEFGREQITHFPGCGFTDRLELSGLQKAAQSVDTIVLALGEASYTEFLGNIDDLNLPDVQIQLARACLEIGKPIVLLLLGGRPRLISRFETGIPAMLTATYPGQAGAMALAAAISGRLNPSGRLAITYPRNPNDLLTYDHKTTENRELQGMPPDFTPQFDFGHGLSYGESIEYRKLAVESDKTAGSISVKVAVYNPQSTARPHIIQLHLRDHVASITPPNRRLVRFRRIMVAAKSRLSIEFSLQKTDFTFIGIDCRPTYEAGVFSLYAGPLTVEFRLDDRQRIVSIDKSPP